MTTRYNRTTGNFDSLPPMAVRRGEAIVAIAGKHRSRNTYGRADTDLPAIHLNPSDLRDLQDAARWMALPREAVRWDEPELMKLFGMALEADGAVPRGDVRFVDRYPIVVDTSEDIED